MNTTSVLNPILYSRLVARYKHVRVASRGLAMQAKRVFDPIERRDKLNVLSAGEYYNICCPFCGDTRFRLEISHRWLVKDPEGDMSVGDNRALAHCFNESCLSDPQNLADLIESLQGTRNVLSSAKVLPGRILSEEERQSRLPGPCRRLSELRKSHPSRAFLVGRFIDPDIVDQEFGVLYCEASALTDVGGRIIAPCYRRQKLVGWQGRHVGDLDWKREGMPPKWYSEPGRWRSVNLYNLDQASGYPTGVLVEGPADVWSFGPMACASFGSSISLEQCNLFHAAFRFGSAVLLFDPDMMDEKQTQRRTKYEQTFLSLRQRGFQGGIARVQLPSRRADPGFLCREFLHAYVASEAAKQGVTCNWKAAAA